MAYVRKGGEKMLIYMLLNKSYPHLSGMNLGGPLTSASPYVMCPLALKRVVTGCGQGLYLGWVLINEELTPIPCVNWWRLNPQVSETVKLQ